jgi:hypothetical protein
VGSPACLTPMWTTVGPELSLRSIGLDFEG